MIQQSQEYFKIVALKLNNVLRVQWNDFMWILLERLNDTLGHSKYVIVEYECIMNRKSIFCFQIWIIFMEVGIEIYGTSIQHHSMKSRCENIRVKINVWSKHMSFKKISQLKIMNKTDLPHVTILYSIHTTFSKIYFWLSISINFCGCLK